MWRFCTCTYKSVRAMITLAAAFSNEGDLRPLLDREVRHIRGRGAINVWGPENGAAVTADASTSGDVGILISDNRDACVAFESDFHTHEPKLHKLCTKALVDVGRGAFDPVRLCKETVGEVTFIVAGKGHRWWAIRDAFGTTPLYYGWDRTWSCVRVSTSRDFLCSDIGGVHLVPAGHYVSYLTHMRPMPWYVDFVSHHSPSSTLECLLQKATRKSIQTRCTDRTGIFILPTAASLLLSRTLAGLGITGLHTVVVRFICDDKSDTVEDEPPPSLHGVAVAFDRRAGLRVARDILPLVTVEDYKKALIDCVPFWFALAAAHRAGCRQLLVPYGNESAIRYDNVTRALDAAAMKRMGDMFNVRVKFPLLDVALNEHAARFPHETVSITKEEVRKPEPWADWHASFEDWFLETAVACDRCELLKRLG